MKKLKAVYFNDNEIEIYFQGKLLEVLDRSAIIHKYNKDPNRLKKLKQIVFYTR